MDLNNILLRAEKTDRNHELSGPVSDRCLVVNNSSVCSRVLPVSQHRPVQYPLGISTSAINQAMPAAAVKVSYVRTPPKKNYEP